MKLDIKLCKLTEKPICFLLVMLFFSSSLISGELTKTVQSDAVERDSVKVALSAAFVSEAGIGVYEELVNYISVKLDRKVDLISGFSYTTINNMFDSGMIDFAFVCGLPLILNQQNSDSKMELLLAPVMKNSKYNDKPVYYSYVIVNKKSKYKTFSDLKGSRLVFNDEISNSGYNMLRSHLIDLGEMSGYFSDVVRSGSHEESIRMVALGEADVSAVDSLVYDFEIEKNNVYVKKLNVIETLGPAGIPPVVVSSVIDLNVREEMIKVLLEMKEDPVGKAILDKALVDRFILVDNKNYDSIRDMYNKAKMSGYLRIK
ncbi:MAG: hypothetical protein DIZ80_03685 [endosymbiont of Galathealinum brachiosum]|uniref:Phosphate/phosphite/phosphonate ABC transporter substrate-binding protein n=1 Tax=endosymbiont of Galathealinum brachiosum TaxID=2200906 RepID=A0A370DI30_9GAMM|nr:MAG: hypothetical protein DIZ80_03685 [endosymbiont of Galathealinum brachiosum]